MKDLEDRQCTGKKGYPDEMSAKIAMAQQGRAGHLARQAKMSIYKCPFCGYWHMGHSETGKPWREIWS